jgi:hypothetical protein
MHKTIAVVTIQLEGKSHFNEGVLPGLDLDLCSPELHVHFRQELETFKKAHVEKYPRYKDAFFCYQAFKVEFPDPVAEMSIFDIGLSASTSAVLAMRLGELKVKTVCPVSSIISKTEQELLTFFSGSYAFLNFSSSYAFVNEVKQKLANYGLSLAVPKEE